MALYNPAAWYWLGQPVGETSAVIYSSADGALIPATDPTYQAWLASPAAPTVWPADATGNVTYDALDQVLVDAGQPPTGLNFPSLGAATIAACSIAAQFVLAQANTDPIHQAAGVQAGTLVIMNGGPPPSTSPFFAAFNAYAASYGQTPAAFAVLVAGLANGLLNLSAAFGALEARAAAATNVAQLQTALAQFEAAVTGVVASVNTAGPPRPLVAPPAIVVTGVNA